MHLESFIGQVVLIDNGGEKGLFYGCVVGVNNEKLHVVEYTKPVDFSLLDDKQHVLADVNVVINDLQAELKMLRAEYDSNMSSKTSAKLESSILQLAKKQLCEIEEREWHSIVDPNILPESSKLICDLVIAVLQNSDLSIDRKTLQSAILDGSLVKMLCSLDEKPMKRSTYEKVLLKYTSAPLFFDICAREFRIVDSLQKWLGAFLDYQNAKNFLNDRNKIEQRINTCVKNIRMATRQRQQLKAELQLLLSGHVLERGDTVYVVPVTSCLRVFGSSPETQYFSEGHTSGHDAEFCEVLDQSDSLAKNGADVIHKKSVLHDEKLKNIDGRTEAFFYINCCEQLQKDLLQCNTQTLFLQKKLHDLTVETVSGNVDSDLECRRLKAEVLLLKRNNSLLLQKVLSAKRAIRNIYLQQCKEQQQKAQQEKCLEAVLSLFKKLGEEHKLLLKDHEALFDAYSKTAECVRNQIDL